MRIIGRNLNITEYMQLAIENKFNFLSKLSLWDSIVVTVQKENNIYIKTSIILKYKKEIIKISDIDTDFYFGLDNLELKLKRKMRKIKEKQQQFKNINITDTFLEKDNIDSDIDTDKPIITERKTFSAKALSEEEAILQMNCLNYDSFVFKNSDFDCKTCLIYRKKDNSYGILEEEY